jgi:PTS system mannose-specific IIA component
MIGIVIVTHNQLGDSLIDAAELIIGRRPEAVVAVSTDSTDNPDKLRKKIAKGIKAVNRRKGVLIFTDMFGGTPSNLSYTFLKEGRVDVISAVNLPILIKAVISRKKMGFVSLAKCLEAYGKRSISLASEILKGKGRTSSSLCAFPESGCKFKETIPECQVFSKVA